MHFSNTGFPYPPQHEQIIGVPKKFKMPRFVFFFILLISSDLQFKMLYRLHWCPIELTYICTKVRAHRKQVCITIEH